MKNLVSVIVPVYNAEKHIASFLESILNQEHDNIELILVNDGSIDNTEFIINSYISSLEEKKIKVVLVKQVNSGAAAAVKAGLEVSTGEYIVWPDSDDILLPSSISKRLEALKKKNVDVVVSDSYYSNDYKTYKPTSLKFVNEPVESRRQRVINAINRVYSVQPAGIMVKKQALTELCIAKNFYISPEGQNYQLYLPLLYCKEWMKLDEPLQIILVHSTSHSRRKRSLTQKLQRAKEIKNIIDKTISSIDNVEESDKYEFARASLRQYRWDCLEAILSSARLNLFFIVLKRIKK